MDQDQKILNVYNLVRCRLITKDTAVNFLYDAGIEKKTAKNTVEIWQRIKDEFCY